MGATASLEPAALAVDPGGQTSCDVKVRNSGAIVDQYTFEVLGPVASWATVDPPALSLFPGAEGTVRLNFSPPRSATSYAGTAPFAVRVVSQEDPEGSVVEEGTLEIGRFDELFAELTPRTSKARRNGKHQVAYDNRGNAPVNTSLVAVDPNDQLTFAIAPTVLVAQPGTANFAKPIARPKKSFWWGPDKTHSFRVEARPEVGEPVTADGTMLQQAIIPKWLPMVIGALAVIALLWFFFLRPQIESTAETAAEEKVEKAVEEPLEEAQEDIAALEEAGGGGAEEPGEEETAPPEDEPTEGEGGQGGEDGAGGGGLDIDIGRSFDGRLEADGTTSFTVPDDQRLSITDLVLANPEGDSGTMTLLRDEDRLLVFRLDNFRDLDYHFIAPLVFTGGESFVMDVNCQNRGPRDCTPSLYFVGGIKRS